MAPPDLSPLTDILGFLLRLTMGLSGLLLILGALKAVKEGMLVRGTPVAKERFRMATVAFILAGLILFWVFS
ncbi:hypothetical protein H8D30_03125 [bacterium]|nr:hypothetical protein [bacterium]